MSCTGFKKRNSIKKICGLLLSSLVAAMVFADDMEIEICPPEPEETTIEIPVDVGQLFSESAESASQSEQVNRLLSLLKSKTEEAVTGKEFGKSLTDSIQQIEDLKQELFDLMNNSVSEATKAELRERMNLEIEDRINQTFRAAEVNDNGSLNERGQKRLENDIEAIKNKYEALMNPGAVDAESESQVLFLKQKIGNEVAALESKKYVESSLKDGNVAFSAGKFSTIDGVEGWPYRISYSIDGNEIYSYAGILTYREISGRSIPQVPSVRSSTYEDDCKVYENFLDSVEVFNAAFTQNVDFIEALLNCSVKRGSEPSSYVITVDGFSLKNVVTGKNISANYKKIETVYETDPKIDVDFVVPSSTVPETLNVSVEPTVEDEIIAAVKETPAEERLNQEKVVDHSTVVQEPKQEPVVDLQVEITFDQDEVRTDREKKFPKRKENDSSTKKSKGGLSGEMNTYSSVLYFLPGTVNIYFDSYGDSVLTVGYALTGAVAPHCYLGVSAEFSPFVDDADFDFNNFALTGRVGWNWSFGSACRLSTFVDCGLLFGNLAAGTGVTLELSSASGNMAFVMGATNYITDTLDSVTKLSFGMELLF